MLLKWDEPTAKDEIVAAARSTLARLAEVPAPAVGSNLAGGTASLVEAHVSDLPLPAYSIPLDYLTGVGGLDGAGVLSWRVFVIDRADEPLGIAEILPPADGKPARFVGYSRGPQAASLGKALTDNESNPVEYQPRLLEIPGLDASALWLKDLDSGKDRVIPVEPIPRFLRARTSYSSTEFLDLVRSRAATRLQFDDTPTLPVDAVESIV